MSDLPQAASPADLADLLARILRFDLLRPVLQPIFRITDGSVFGFEGLIRGPSGSELEPAPALFAVAERCDRRTDLELAALRAICRQFTAQKLPGQLLLNLSCGALEAHGTHEIDEVIRVIEASGLACASVVIELTEHEHIRDARRFAQSLAALREAGMMLALDDFGSGHSNLHLWMELRPRLVKLDRVFVHGLSANGDKFEIARFMKGLADSFGTELVAEGVEEPSDLAVVRDMGIELAQGFLLGRPAPFPDRRLASQAAAVLRSVKLSLVPQRVQPPQRFMLVGELSRPYPAVPDTMSNETLAQLLHRHPEYHALALVNEGRPIGLINRRSFMDRLAQPFYREVYARRPATTFMHEAPLLLDRRTPLESITRVLAGEDQRYLTDGFIVTDNGQYVGMGTGDALVRAVSELRIEAARYANPLTLLPGNIPISQHLDRLLADGTTFAACYADLNNFKPFNDQYGYWRGDEMIRLVAAVLQDHTDPSVDFVGHVGGDDFLIAFQSDDWRPRCERIIAEFNRRARDFFSPEEAGAGCFDGEDRKGVRCRFPLTTIALGVVVVSAGTEDDAEAVASRAALAKRHAKSGGPALYILDAASEPQRQALASA